MSNELLPCPFCGGKAVILVDATRPASYRDRLRVGCETAGCRGFYHAAWAYYETPEQAAEAWNTRLQGTCKVKRSTDMTDPYEYAPHEYWRYHMECGGHFDWDEPTPPEFCPCCGGKVER